MKKIIGILLISYLLLVGLAYAGTTDDFDVTVRPEFTEPQFSNEDPTNGSTIRVTSYRWNITITDFVPFNWSINCSNGQNSSGNNDTNGTFSLNLTNLVTYTTYTVWVNATNGNLSTNASYIFTVMPEPTAPRGGMWVPPVAEDEIVLEPALTTDNIVQIGIIIVFLITLFLMILVFKRKKKKK